MKNQKLDNLQTLTENNFESSVFNFFIPSGAQCRAARALLNWPMKVLANYANLSVKTINTFENESRVPIKNNLVAIKSTFEAHGITFCKTGGVCLTCRAQKSCM